MKSPTLKTVIMLFVMITCSTVFAQNSNVIRPYGVNTESEIILNKRYRFSAFFFKDKTGRFWSGYGGASPSLNETHSGLISISNNVWTEHSPSVFTGYIERGDTIIFSATNGLHYFANETFKHDKRYTNLRSLVLHKGRLIAASEGKGLLIENATGFTSVILQSQGQSYDSIYSLFSHGEELWIGTSKGLIRVLGEINNQSPILTIASTKIPGISDLVIRDVVKDKYDRVWFIGQRGQHSRSIFIYEKNEVTTIHDLFSSACNILTLIPEYLVLKLNLNKKGNVMIQSKRKLNEFTLNSILSYSLSDKNTFTHTNGYLYENAIYSDTENTMYVINGDILIGFDSIQLLKIEFDKYSYLNILNKSNYNVQIADINKVESAVGNNGIHLGSFLMGDFLESKAPFRISDIGCANPLFIGTLWMGGLEVTSNQLHLAAEKYRQGGSEFRSGPIEFDYDIDKHADFNRIWKVNKKTIDYFIAHRTDPNYIIPQEILEWPANLEGYPNKPMAPFVDINNNGIYEPHLGDYPKIKGDQMLWWIFNDRNIHHETYGEPLGVEVHGSCYAYFHSDLAPNHPDAIVNRTLFLNYKTFNYSKNDYKDFKVGIYNSFSLGNYLDDRIGCDTINNASFVYNATNFDEYTENNNYSNIHGYGKNPPIFFCKFLNQKMTNHMTFNNNFDPISGNPNNALHHYNLLNSERKNGAKLTIGGTGLQGDIETNYIFPGPICGDTGWTEQGENALPNSKRSITSTGIDLFQKDSVFELEFAYILLHDPNVDYLTEDCDKPAKILQKVQQWYDADSFPSKPPTELGFAKNTEWYYDVSHRILHTALQHYTHIADTTIEGKPVRIVEEELKNINGIYSLSKLYFHEEGDTVYLYNFEKQKFLRFLVFNVPVGGVIELDIVDGFELYPDSIKTYKLKIKRIETKFFNGRPCKYYVADILTPYTGNVAFMDRIGWFTRFYPDVLPYVDKRVGGLRCYSDNDIDTNFRNVSCNYMYGLSVPKINTSFSFSVFPNPANDILNIELNKMNQVDFSSSIMSIEGRILQKSNNLHQLDISSLSPGIYYLIIKSGSESQFCKWIKL
jgi:hypothetical protein